MPTLMNGVPFRVRVPRSGFTLIELMVTLTVLSVVLIVLGTVMLSASRSRTTTTNQIEAVQAARAAVDILARDLRSAGFGSDQDDVNPQPAIAYIDSMQILLCANQAPYPDTGAVHLAPLAYNPTGNPKPYPLNGTPWTPPVRYATGAELIRWTLDVNNDGAVDSYDLSDPNGIDARRTPNPDDFVLVRQVWGDSTGNVAKNNGGASERIALIRKPGGTVKPLFTVYLRGQGTPWNWASGPIPASQLQDVERVILNMTAASGRPDWRGTFAETELKLEVNILRNSPSFDIEEFSIAGYVWNDKDMDSVKDGGEDGIPNAEVSLADYMVTATDNNGYYQFAVPAGTYTLRHKAPAGFGPFTVDSFVVSVGPNATRSFGDTTRAGGWVKFEVFNDLDNDRSKDGDEPWKSYVKCLVNDDTTTVQETDETGTVMVFAPIGNYKASIVVPDSFSASTATFFTGTMGDGQTKTHRFGVHLANFGTIRGTVFIDNNKNGLLDSKEPRVKNVWIGVGLEDGTLLAYDYTADDGTYEIKMPVNDPPQVDGYYVQCIPPNGYSAASVLTSGPLWVQDGVTLSGQDFALGTFYVIRADAKRVLSLASGDLFENDWGFTLTTTPRRDQDIVLGAEASGVDNVMVWFNRYEQQPLFDSKPSYTRDAPHSVLAISLDSLDYNPPRRRLDVVTGTRYTPTGNFFVWLTQNTSDNEGYLAPTYLQACKTLDNGDVQVVKTRQLIGGPGKDILVGTRGPTPGTGSLELWAHNEATTPTYVRIGQYPPAGGMPSNLLGEVTCMEFSDFDKDSLLDLVVGTRTGEYTGQLMFFEQVSGVFTYRTGITFTGDVVTSLVVLDMNDDGKMDVVAGTECGIACGKLHYFRNDDTPGSPFKFSLERTRPSPGIVMAMAADDYGGEPRKDLLVGWRANANDYVGGIQIWYTDGKDLPEAGVDPSGGAVKHMVTGITTGNYDFGVYPVTPSPPYFKDFALGVKSNSTAGELVVFVR